MEKLNWEEIKQKSRELKSLANEHRLGIILYLKKKKTASVGEIADNLKISFKATSKHLLFLKKAGVLVKRFDNPFVYYSLSSNSSKLIKDLISFL
jgi:DNA-binding transcriptional ArsR family regulator